MKNILLLGDSITAGLGSKKVNFQEELKNKLNNKYIIDNWALTGTTINYPIEHLEEIINSNADIIIILYGNVDAQIRPNRNGKIYRLLPKRFKLGEGSMILPRPFYSSNTWKMMIQKFENIIRTIIRKLIIFIDGTEQWIPIDIFSEKYDHLCIELIKNGKKIVTCSTVFIDNKLFNNSSEQYQLYNNVIELCSEKYKLPYIDVYTFLKNEVEQRGWNDSYNYDHFHPNGKGYKKIAKLIADKIKEEENL